MGAVLVSFQGASSSARNRSKPVRAVRGRRRRAIQKLKHYAQLVLEQDFRESLHAAEKGYAPITFIGSEGTPADLALQKVISRCEGMLTTFVS